MFSYVTYVSEKSKITPKSANSVRSRYFCQCFYTLPMFRKMITPKCAILYGVDIFVNEFICYHLGFGKINDHAKMR